MLGNCPICKMQDFLKQCKINYFNMFICDSCKTKILEYLGKFHETPLEYNIMETLRCAQISYTWSQDYHDFPHMVENSKKRMNKLLEEVNVLIHNK